MKEKDFFSAVRNQPLEKIKEIVATISKDKSPFDTYNGKTSNLGSLNTRFKLPQSKIIPQSLLKKINSLEIYEPTSKLQEKINEQLTSKGEANIPLDTYIKKEEVEALAAGEPAVNIGYAPYTFTVTNNEEITEEAKNLKEKSEGIVKEKEEKIKELENELKKGPDKTDIYKEINKLKKQPYPSIKLKEEYSDRKTFPVSLVSSEGNKIRGNLKTSEIPYLKYLSSQAISKKSGELTKKIDLFNYLVYPSTNKIKSMYEEYVKKNPTFFSDLDEKEKTTEDKERSFEAQLQAKEEEKDIPVVGTVTVNTEGMSHVSRIIFIEKDLKNIIEKIKLDIQKVRNDLGINGQGSPYLKNIETELKKFYDEIKGMEDNKEYVFKPSKNKILITENLKDLINKKEINSKEIKELLKIIEDNKLEEARKAAEEIIKKTFLEYNLPNTKIGIIASGKDNIFLISDNKPIIALYGFIKKVKDSYTDKEIDDIRKNSALQNELRTEYDKRLKEFTSIIEKEKEKKEVPSGGRKIGDILNLKKGEESPEEESEEETSKDLFNIEL
jgi:hypothetical protein